MNYIDLVEALNQEFYELTGSKELELFIEENPPFQLRSIGYAHCIEFFDIPVWDSENDERPYENEDDPKLCDQVPLEPWIRQEVKRILNLFSELNAVMISKEIIKGE